MMFNMSVYKNRIAILIQQKNHERKLTKIQHESRSVIYSSNYLASFEVNHQCFVSRERLLTNRHDALSFVVSMLSFVYNMYCDYVIA